MRRLLFTLMSLACPLVLAATVYKWVDENGVVHYSDQPHPNAEKVQVQGVQTYRETPLPASGPTAVQSQSPNSIGGYQGCAVTAPADGEEFANVQSITVVVRTDPPLRSGDQIFITYDGAPFSGGRPVGPQVTISPVDRGTHTLQATVRDGSGALMCQTPGVSFSIHQASILNPNNPVRPH